MVLKSPLLIIFSKTPLRGKVKTRLRTALTEEQCLSLHVAMLKDTFLKCKATGVHTIVYLSEPTHEFPTDMTIRIQKGSDLGERMANAFSETLKEYSKVVLIGTDAPFLSPQDLRFGFEALDYSDAVLSPTMDGGYSLIGMRRMIPEVFQNISWSTDQVFSQTLQALSRYQVTLLKETFDIDEPADLQHLIQMIPGRTEEWLAHLRVWLEGYSTR